MRKPVCRLRKALYGHPDAETFWEDKCEAHLKTEGFRAVGSEWPSVFFHDALKLYLVIYVDDFNYRVLRKTSRLAGH